MWQFLWETVGLGREHVADWQPAWREPTPFPGARDSAPILVALLSPRAFGSQLACGVHCGGACASRASCRAVSMPFTLWRSPSSSRRSSAKRQPPMMSGWESHAASIPESRQTAWLSATAVLLTCSGSFGVECMGQRALRPVPGPRTVARAGTRVIPPGQRPAGPHADLVQLRRIRDLAPRAAHDGLVRRAARTVHQRLHRRHNRFYRAPSALLASPTRFTPISCGCPGSSPSVRLSRSRGWVRLFEGRISTIWSRRPCPCDTPRRRPWRALFPRAVMTLTHFRARTRGLRFRRALAPAAAA